MIETNQFIDFQIGHDWESFQIFGELDDSQNVFLHGLGGLGVEIKIFYPSEGGGGVGKENFNNFNAYHAEEILKLIYFSEKLKENDYHLKLESDDDILEAKWEVNGDFSIGVKTLGARAKRNGDSLYNDNIGMKWSTLSDSNEIEKFKSFLMIYAGINKWGY